MTSTIELQKSESFAPFLVHQQELPSLDSVPGGGRVFPVAVPGIFVADGAASSSADRGHSLRSLDSATGGAPIAPPHGVTGTIKLQTDNESFTPFPVQEDGSYLCNSCGGHFADEACTQALSAVPSSAATGAKPLVIALWILAGCFLIAAVVGIVFLICWKKK